MFEQIGTSYARTHVWVRAFWVCCIFRMGFYVSGSSENAQEIGDIFHRAQSMLCTK